MKALVCHSLDGIDGLKLELDWPEPALKPGTVLLDVAAAALNFPDLLMLRGLYQVRPPLPWIPGMEMAGTIAAVGEGVTRHKVGDRVIAYAGAAAAERAVVPQERLLPLPSHSRLRVRLRCQRDLLHQLPRAQAARATGRR